jgi:hypothetical protein
VFTWIAAGLIAATSGGGFTDYGLHGSYFPNPELKGEPSFTRRDVRLDFTWTDARPVGGSRTPALAGFPNQGFSVKWQGAIVPRFSGPTRIELDVGGEASLTLLLPGQEPRSFSTEKGSLRAEVDLERGTPVPLAIEYRHRSGPAGCRFRWSGPDFPSEVVGPVSHAALNIGRYSYDSYLFADLMRSARYGDRSDHVDDDGWPTDDDVELVLAENRLELPQHVGMYQLQFNGRAKVEITCCVDAVFTVGGQRYEGSLPAGVGYNPNTGLTRARVHFNGSRVLLRFQDTSRDGKKKGNGVTDIHFMRPRAVGGSQPHRVGAVAYQPMARVISNHYSALRYLGGGNDSEERRWEDRLRPNHAFFADEKRENWESLVMLANETGKDLYLSLPVAADDDYHEKLARLLRYGSDGREPYPSFTSRPKYPPLNSNLKVYVEVGNEIWNWPFESTDLAKNESQRAADENSADWKIINYDGDAREPGHIRAVRRWHALRTVRCSNTFRRVFGEEWGRVRMMLLYQYENFQETALHSFEFIDDFFGSDQFVDEPHPISYFIWGSGGASYYGLNNKDGSQTELKLADRSFEQPTLGRNQHRQRPSGSAWTFAGNAGLVRAESPGRKIGPLQSPAVSVQGKQAAYLRMNGSFSQRVRFPKRGVYALAFHAAGQNTGWQGYARFGIQVDGQPINPMAQHLTVPDVQANIGGWGRDLDELDERYGSLPFLVDAPGEKTIAFVGQDDDPERFLLVDDVELLSVDAMMESGLGEGEALGQTGRAEFRRQMREQAKYARSFGLEIVAYEAGWSVGGDFGQIPIQNWAKFKDPRAKRWNDLATTEFQNAAGFMQAFGVYRYFPVHDLPQAASYPLMQSIAAAGRRLPADDELDGHTIPVELGADDAAWSLDVRPHSSGEGFTGWLRGCVTPTKRPPRPAWYAYMLVAPRTGRHRIVVRGRNPEAMELRVDGRPIPTEVSGGERFGVHTFYPGAHVLRVIVPAGSDLRTVEVEAAVP